MPPRIPDDRRGAILADVRLLTMTISGHFDATPAAVAALFQPDQAPRYALTIRSEVPVQLRTGRRGRGESRADHAGRVRLARFKRASCRRSGVPAATVQRQDYWPSVSIVDMFRAREQPLVDKIQRRQASFGRAWSDVLGFVASADADWATQAWNWPDVRDQTT